ncbi:hypothetical protein ACQEU5_11615 [Marinactinospora thermotolerans]|uniref:Uncharacterized protein n=1 Tax=Marinactinospora thermotolerans DSM 45154 TaxID=1122192 RepID=A0A1T4SZD4_9ACTN|nr:hypothetical protein [Marinactinospora thermotolerans]SKA33593.1 hypothetical protein SAMN02745673_04234 [Marinactinospora thermotolerans DSM 45154]
MLKKISAVIAISAAALLGTALPAVAEDAATTATQLASYLTGADQAQGGEDQRVLASGSWNWY